MSKENVLFGASAAPPNKEPLHRRPGFKYVSFTKFNFTERRQYVDRFRPWIEQNCELYEYNISYLGYTSLDDPDYNDYIVGVTLSEEDALMFVLMFEELS